MSSKRVLVVCTGNTCRSVMAAAFLRELAADYGLDIRVESAGTMAMPGDPPTTCTEEVMKENGIDVSGHRSRRLQGALVEDSDLILVMTQSHKRQLLSLFPEAADKVQLLTEAAAENTAGEQETSLAEAKGKMDQDQLDITDPFGGSLEQYRATARQIREAVVNILEMWQREVD